MLRTTFVGRESELRWLRRRLGDPLVGLVVRGPAGIGKTRLVREAVSAEPALHWLHATPDRQLLAVGGLPGTHVELDEAAERLREDLTGPSRTGVLVIDDAHHLDPGAATVVQRLVDAPDVKVVLTLRDGEPTTSALDRLIAGQEQVELTALPGDDVVELVEDIVGGPVAAGAAGQVLRLAHGNPMYASELVRDALARELLSPRPDGSHDLTGQLEPPPELADLVAARVDRLPNDAVRLLQLLSLSEPMRLGMLTRLTTATAYGRLDEAGLVATRGGEVEVAHPLVSEAVRHRMDPDVRATLSARLLATVGRGHPDGPLRAARWALDAGAPEVDLLLEGARIANAWLSHGLARRLATAAVEAGAGVEAEVLLAEALTSLPEGAAEAELRLAAIVGRASGELRAHAMMLRGRNLLFGLRRADRAVRVLTDLLDAPVTERWRTEARAVLAQAELLTGRVDRAARATPLSSSSADPANDTLEAAGLLARTIVGRLEGTGTAIEAVRRRLDAAPDDRVAPLAVPQLELARTFHDLYTGRVDAAVAHADDRWRTAERGSPLTGMWAAASCYAAGLAGRLDDASHAGSEAVALLGEVDLIRTLPLAQAWAAMVEAQRGQLVAAERLLEEMPHDGPDMQAAWFAFHRLLAMGMHAAATGDPSMAEHSLAAADHGLGNGHRLWVAIALHQVARFGDPMRVLARFRAVVADVDPGLGPLLLADAEARAAHDPDALEAVGDRLTVAGARLLAAEAYLAAATCGASGHEGGAERLRRRAAAVLPDRARPWTVAAAPPAEPLADREAVVAGLAAEGLGNRTIADELQVSVRTVENHLARVYRKLGARGRDDLAVLMPSD